MREIHVGPAAERQTLDSVQALRGIAASFVLLFHLAARERDYGQGNFGVVRAFLYFGAQGVDLFFVISGFIITWTNFDSFGDTARIPTYLARRVTRIFPLYWVFFGFAFVTARLGFNHALDRADNPWNLFEIFFLLPIEAVHIVPVSWTLAFELFFYGVFALALRWDRSRFPAILLAWFLFVVAANISTHTGDQSLSLIHRVSNVVLNFRTIEFMLGCFIALRLKRRPLRAPIWWFIAGSLIFAAGAIRMSAVEPLAQVAVVAFFGLGSAGIVAGAVAYERSHGGAFVPRWLVTLGDASYSLYLVHVFVFAVLHRALEPLNRSGLLWHLSWLVVLGGSGFVGGLMAYRFIERPILEAAGKAIRRHLSRGGVKLA